MKSRCLWLGFVSTIRSGEVVLDSFAGSDLVGEAAFNKKRNYILIEILKDNINRIKERLSKKIYFQAVYE